MRDGVWRDMRDAQDERRSQQNDDCVQSKRSVPCEDACIPDVLHARISNVGFGERIRKECGETRTRRLWGSPWRRSWMLREPRVPSCTQRRSEPAHKDTNKAAPKHAHARVKTGRAVIGARKGCWGLSSPRAGGGSGKSGRGVCGSKTRAAERRRT